MYMANNEIYFDTRKDQIEYNIVYNYIMSFYETKEDLVGFKNNLEFFRNNEDETPYQCFIKSLKTILKLFLLEHPNYKYLYDNYKKDIENNVMGFALQKSYDDLVKKSKNVKERI